jgi:hypothetical protein
MMTQVAPVEGRQSREQLTHLVHENDEMSRDSPPRFSSERLA